MTAPGRPALPVVLDALQELPHQVLLERLDHLGLPDVEAQLSDLLHLLRGLNRQGAVGELGVAELLFLDVLSVEVEIELVKVVNTTTELFPTVVVTTQQVLLSGLPHFGQFLTGNLSFTGKI